MREIRVAVLAASAAMLAGCLTPLHKKVKDYGFEPFATPTSADRSGWTFDKGSQQPLGKKCFKGDPSPGKSFSKDTVTYTRKSVKDFRTDWKDLFSLALWNSSTGTVTVTLENVEERVYGDPAPTFDDACLTDENVYVPKRDVITHQLKAGKISVTVNESSESTGSIKIALETAAALGLTPIERQEAVLSLAKGKTSVLVGKDLFVGFKTSRMTPKLIDEEVVLSRDAARVDVGGYQLLLEDLYENSLGVGTAKVSLEGSGVKFKKIAKTVRVGDRLDGVRTGYRLDYFRVEHASRENLKLRFHSIFYERR